MNIIPEETVARLLGGISFQRRLWPGCWVNISKEGKVATGQAAGGISA
jgi:hypothetical protein